MQETHHAKNWSNQNAFELHSGPESAAILIVNQGHDLAVVTADQKQVNVMPMGSTVVRGRKVAVQAGQALKTKGTFQVLPAGS